MNITSCTEIYFAKIRDSAKIPSKNLEDAGFDIYADFEEPYKFIRPNETVLIPTGIASCCSSDYCFIFKERSSTATKGISLRSGVIDSGYRGEWIVALTNVSDDWICIAKDGVKVPIESKIIPYDRAICQALLVPVPKVQATEIAYEELRQIGSQRGVGGFGSTGK